MKNISLEKVLNEGLTDDIVEQMMMMSEEQSLEWKELFRNLPKKLVFEYARKQGRIQKKLAMQDYQNMSQREREIKHLRGFQVIAHLADGLTFGEELLLKAKEREEEEFTFFWATGSLFSQWYKCSFKAERIFRTPDYLEEFEREIMFSSAEQFMMYHKCLLSLNFDAALEVLSTRDPKKQKKIGRTIKMTMEILETWEVFRTSVIYDANKAKFTQDKELKEALFATRGTTLVEAAPNDAIWGIGLTEDDPKALNRATWQGKNLLGEILTQIRIELMGEY
jgi:ribA/ribD-fused uncharacterized protein